MTWQMTGHYYWSAEADSAASAAEMPFGRNSHNKPQPALFTTQSSTEST